MHECCDADKPDVCVTCVTELMTMTWHSMIGLKSFVALYWCCGIHGHFSRGHFSGRTFPAVRVLRCYLLSIESWWLMNKDEYFSFSASGLAVNKVAAECVQFGRRSSPLWEAAAEQPSQEQLLSLGPGSVRPTGSADRGRTHCIHRLHRERQGAYYIQTATSPHTCCHTTLWNLNAELCPFATAFPYKNNGKSLLTVTRS